MTVLIDISTSYPNFKTNLLLFLSFPTASSPSSSPSLVILLQFLISHRLGSNRIIWLLADLPPLPTFLSLPFLLSCGCLFISCRGVIRWLLWASERRSWLWGLSAFPQSIHCKLLQSWHLPHLGCGVKGEDSSSDCGTRVLWQQEQWYVSIRWWGFSYWILRRCPILYNPSWLHLHC